MMAKTRRSTASTAAAAVMKPASYSSSSLSNMSSSSWLRRFLVLLVTSSVLLSVSDGASVPITTTSSSSSSAFPSTTIKINPSSASSSTRDDDFHILESLASSRILMDHSSSSSSNFISKESAIHSTSAAADDDVMSSENRIEKAEEVITTTTTASSSVTTGSTTLLPTSSKVSSSFSGDSSSSSSSSSSSPTTDSSAYAKRMSSSSPLHVARCRATCLEKFQPGKELSTTTTTTTTTASSAVQKHAADHDEQQETSTSADEIHLLPILRLKRRKRSSESTNAAAVVISAKSTNPKSKNLKVSPLSPRNCLQNSPDCLNCWKSCELLESQDASTDDKQRKDANEPTKMTKLEGDVAAKRESDKKQQSILSCSSNKQCTDGCQVACSFYQRLYQTTSGENNEDAFSSTATDPVVAMKHERIVKIAPGKITWPPLRNIRKESSSLSASLPVVYVVIQEYPDRKWRQIAQTTETEIDIPTELTSSMSTKLRSVRVLVVGKKGLLSVYNPEKSLEQEVGQERKSSGSSRQADNSNNSGKVNRTSPESDSNNVSQKTDATASAAGGEEHYGSVVDAVTNAANDQSVYANTPVTTNTPTPTAIAAVVVSDDVTVDSSDSSDKPAEQPFELRVVSLIHQKSLVIAELRWDEIGGNPNQDYLITWELTGGGLKGHLVTDSTSVTLSLWPDTTYQIQVEKFQQNLDGDGDQTGVESVALSPSEKSLPLTVDTSEASFPMEQPSALLGNGGGGDIDDEDSEDDYEDEDVSVREGKLSVALGMGVESQFQQQQQQQQNMRVQDPAAHKSITTGGFLNMTLLIGIAISALLFVLVILTVAAFTWTRMRAVSASPYAHHQHHRHHHHHHNRSSSPASFDYCSSSPMITPTKNSRNSSSHLENCDRMMMSGGDGECCYDCEVGDIDGNDGRRCFSDNSEPQPLFYCREDEYSWDDQCHNPHHHHQKETLYSSPSSYYSMGLNYYHHSSKDDANGILHHCSYETSSQNRKGSESSGVAVISGSSNLTMPLMSSVYPGSGSSPSYLGYCRNGGSDNIAYSLLGDSSLRTTHNGREGQQSRH